MKHCCQKWEEFSEEHNCTFIYCPECGKNYSDDINTCDCENQPCLNHQLDLSVRPLGRITDDLEPILQEMVNDHEMQIGEILYLVYGYLMIHCPEAEEEYEDGSNPKLEYN